MKFTTDSLFEGALSLRQPAEGYRYNIDSVLLAHRVAMERPKSVVDVGAGCGVIGLAIAHLCRPERVLAIERQPALARALGANAATFSNVEVIEADVRAVSMERTDRFEAVVMNPPYYTPGRGRMNPDPQKAAARHQLHGSIVELVAACARLAAKSVGTIHSIYPARQGPELVGALRTAGFAKLRIRWIHSRAADPAKLMMVTAFDRSYPEWEVEPPLVVYRGSNDYSEEVEAILRGERTSFSEDHSKP